jgi:3-oxoacyl-[acyl-carrier protein] reductase
LHINKETRMRLAGKVAVVTGAGQGMGRAIAQRFADEGATVVAVDLNEEAARQTLQGKPGKHLARSSNVADSAAVDALFVEIREKLGAVDVLVNNAGVGSVDQFADIPDATWERVIGVNLNGAFYCARAAVKQMQEGKGGAIVNISSTSAVSGDGPAHYCASKAALMGLTRGMAKELASKKIRVTHWFPAPPTRP